MKEDSTFKETTVKDYMDALREKYPLICKKDIQTIVNYGWRLIYLAVVSGCDFLDSCYINDRTWIYIGNLKKYDPLKHYLTYRYKLLRKMKFNYRRMKPEWDGYYYTILFKREKETLLHRMGRPRKKLTLVTRKAFKYKEACRVHYNFPGYMIRFKHPIDRNFDFWIEKMDIYDFEIIQYNKHWLKKSELLTSKNYYELCKLPKQPKLLKARSRMDQ